MLGFVIHHDKKGTTTILRLEGEADILAVPKLERELERVAKAGEVVGLNMSAVGFINTPVWAVISLAAEQGRPRLAIFGMQPAIFVGYRMMGLESDIPHFSSEDQAVAFLSQS